MQTHGYIIIRGEKIKILVRHRKYGRLLRIRKSGTDGTHFSDEEIFLEEYSPEKLALLKNGETIFV